MAVVDIGASAIRVLAAEIHGDQWKAVDAAGRPVSLGRDVFTSGKISRDTQRSCIAILTRFRELLAGWGIAPGQAIVLGTSAVREASNRDTFVDRVMLRTGFLINVIDGIEENQLTYLAVKHAMRNVRGRFRSNALIMEVGAGSTEFLLLRRGRMLAVHALKIGTVRMEDDLQPLVGNPAQLRRILGETLRPTRDALSKELDLQGIRTFICLGADVRLVAERAGRKMDDYHWLITRQAFDSFVETQQERSTDELVQNLQISYDHAESLIPGLLIYQNFLAASGAAELTVLTTSMREGALLRELQDTDQALNEEFRFQIVGAALSLGRKYGFDEKHALHVAEIVLQLFDLLREDHGLPQRYRLLLEVAALLHDIGYFVQASGHHKHGHYVVSNSEIFGIDREDQAIVGAVVRYHRKAMPSPAHPEYIALSREHRIVVGKLAAMLRVADAMDRSHLQRIHSFVAEREEDRLVLRCQYEGDLYLKRLALERKGDLFQEVFGMRVELS